VRPLLFHGFRSGPTRLVAGALALLIAVHGLGAVVLATLGPLHTHTPAATVVVLEDFRRGPSHASASEGPVARHGHTHGARMALRHHHASDDVSVSLAAGEAGRSLDADDAAFGAALAAFVGLVPSAAAWLPQASREVRAVRVAWVPQTHHPEPFERPPRSV
jgi:hypothetical protein